MEDPDFIVVGAGSAGCAVAERLSANGRYKVLVLEAGGTDRRFFIQMPLGYGKTYMDPAVNWMYASEPDPGLAGQQDYWPRGKVLGGSSSINAMVWIRGAPQDYDDWEAAGNPGWGWKEMLPVFKLIEDNDGGESDLRGVGGPMHVSTIDCRVHPLTHSFIKAAGEAGLAFNPDFNGPQQEGAGIWQQNMKGGRRNSAARAFLRPAMKRANVRVLTNAQATRILMEGERATGIEYRRNGRVEQVSARREVIICGGSVNSPQLLQLSGIGPADHLRSLGIEVKVGNWQVGSNLEDHQGVNYTFRANCRTLNDVLRPWWGKMLVGMQYLMFGKGPLSLSINHGGGFFRTDPKLGRPNMQLYFQAFSTVLPGVGERPVLSPDPFSGFSIGLSNCRPRSRGEIMIRSADPFEKPRITANAFSVDSDVADMLAGVKFVRRIAASPSLESMIAEEILPGPSCRSDEELISDFRRRSGTVFHPVSTCRMAPDVRSGVVDARLRVHGVRNLRVIDASVFPGVITGNTNAAAIAVGWRGASFILEDAK